MKRYFHYYLCIPVICLIASCSSSKNSQQTDTAQPSHWQKETLFINGDDSDWIKPLSYTDEKLGFSYSVSNDRENLYLLATSYNNATIQRILRAGLTVYINTHGVKEELGAASISFPTGNRVQKGGRMLNDRQEVLTNNRVAIGAVEDYSLSGFHEVKTPQNFDYGTNNPEGIEVGIGINASNELVYEAKIPLSSFLSRIELANITRKSFTVGFEIENLIDQDGSRGGGGVSIGGGLGIGSFGSGGGLGLSIGSGDLTRIGGGNRRRSKPSKIWKEIVLAGERK